MQVINLTFAPTSTTGVLQVISANVSGRPEVRLTANTPEVVVAAAVAGLGVARLPIYQVARELRSGALELLLADFELAPIPVHVVHVDAQRSNARLRRFVDLLVERLRKERVLGANCLTR